jgi:hypothetical protein
MPIIDGRTDQVKFGLVARFGFAVASIAVDCVVFGMCSRGDGC